MTKSFPLSILVTALSGAGATVSRSVWVTFCILSLPWAWDIVLWLVALMQPSVGYFLTALVFALCEVLYSASPAVLVGAVGAMTCLGVVVSAPAGRGHSD